MILPKETNIDIQNSIPDLGSVHKACRILVAGGGTGGHIFPAIAIANALQKQAPGVDILFVGASGKMEMEKVPQAGYRIEGLDITGFNRQSVVKNLHLPFKILKSFWQVKRIFQSFRPNAVIGVGGYSTFPVLRYAQAKGIPSFIHESNSFAGKANMLLGKKAKKIFVATTGMESFFPAPKIMVTGNPVRKNIAQSVITREEGIAFFKLEPGYKTVLVVGGSLGAGSINEAIAENIEAFEQNNLQLIWQTGKNNADLYNEKAQGRKNIFVEAFIREMDMAYAAADIIISRSGAMAVTEICVVGKPAILVPYPLSAEDHQTANAMNLVNKGAALMLADKAVKKDILSKVVALSGDVALQESLVKNLQALAVRDADEVIAKEILKYCQ